MLSSLLKGNDSLQMGAVTGIMQITKENIFSGLNNLSVNNILSREFGEMFGFTDEEVERICADYGHPDKFEEAKDWYDGYRFGDAEIYNPWSILNYVQKKFDPVPYWVNTSGNSIVEDLLAHADEGVMKDLKVLGEGGSISRDVSVAMTFGDLTGSPDAIYSLMVISGYLKAVPEDTGYVLSIPNRELYSVFAQMIARSAFGNRGTALMNLERFSKAVLAKDIPAMERTLYSLIADTLSSRVLNDEHSYQAFVAGMLMTLSGRYRITADFESGKGYYDIRMERRTGTGCNVVMELKRSDSEDLRGHDAEEAIVQIREKDYARGLTGETVLYGVAFFGKEPLIVSEML
jgi:hypothetical protein